MNGFYGSYVVIMLILIGMMTVASKETKSTMMQNKKSTIACVAIAPICLGMFLGLTIKKITKND